MQTVYIDIEREHSRLLSFYLFKGFVVGATERIKCMTTLIQIWCSAFQFLTNRGFFLGDGSTFIHCGPLHSFFLFSQAIEKNVSNDSECAVRS
jgi:hypothetical protein